MWRDLVVFLFWFRVFTWTMRLLLHSLLERVVVVCVCVCGEGGRGLFKIGGPRSRGWKNLDVDGQEGGRSWKLDNFHGRHMFIVSFNVFHWQFLVTYIFSVSLKFEACCIADQWVEFRIKNATYVFMHFFGTFCCFSS